MQCFIFATELRRKDFTASSLIELNEPSRSMQNHTKSVSLRSPSRKALFTPAVGGRVRSSLKRTPARPSASEHSLSVLSFRFIKPGPRSQAEAAMKKKRGTELLDPPLRLISS